MKKATFRKIAFFWLIFHAIAYISFITKWTPSFEDKKGSLTTINYILTPKYSEKINFVTDVNGVQTITENMMFDRCDSCPYIESKNFYPFHKFTYTLYGRYEQQKGFVGIFGYYGNDEFIVYFLIPLILYIIYALYKFIFKSTNS